MSQPILILQSIYSCSHDGATQTKPKHWNGLPTSNLPLGPQSKWSVMLIDRGHYETRCKACQLEQACINSVLLQQSHYMNTTVPLTTNKQMVKALAAAWSGNSTCHLLQLQLRRQVASASASYRDLSPLFSELKVCFAPLVCD